MDAPVKKPNLFFGVIITIIAYFCFAIASAFVKVINSKISIIQIIFFQCIIGLIFVVPYCIKRKTFSFKTQSLPVHLVRDLTGLLAFVTYFTAIKQLNLVDATVLTYTAPFYTPVIWRIWTRGTLENDVWWTIILGFIGIAFILRPSEEILQPGALLGLLAGILTACSLVSIKILNQRFEPLSRTLLFFFLVGALLSFPFAVYYWSWPNAIQFLQLIIMGSALALGQLLLTIAYRHGTASFLSPLSYFMIIFTMLISWWFFHQTPGWHSFIGASLIIFGGTLTFIFRRKPKTLSHLFMHPHIHKKKRWWHKRKKDDQSH